MKRILWLLIIIGMVLVVYLYSRQKIVSPPDNISFQDVKYYFDTLTFESVSSQIPNYSGGNETVSQTETIRGKVIKVDIPLYCIKAPCPPEKGFALEDVNQSYYKIKEYKIIMAPHPLVDNKLLNKICIIKGDLKIGVYSNSKSIFISQLTPQEVVSCK